MNTKLNGQNDGTVKEILKLYRKLSEERKSLEKAWQEINNYVRPARDVSAYDKSINKEVYDSTAILAAEYLTSALWSLINSSAVSWFYLKPKNNNLKNDALLKEWFTDVNEKMHHMLLDAYSGFYHKSHEFYGDLVAFGSAIFSVAEDLDNKKLKFSTHHLGDTFFFEASNVLDGVIRKVLLTGKEATKKFGFANVSKDVLEAHKKDSDELFLFLHVVVPSSYFNDEATALKNMKYSSYYIDTAGEKIVLKGGYYEFPYIIARWQTNSKQTYGQSPAMLAMPDIKMLNIMSKTMIIAAQKQIDPTILATNEAAVQGIKTAPGGIIYGGIDPVTGNQLVRPLQVNSDMNSSYALQEQRRTAVKEAFYHSLLMFKYSNNATATEVLSTNEQKLRILGAKVARIQSEFLYPLLKRQYLIMLRLNLFNKPPQELNVEDIEIDFCGAWNKYQKNLDTAGIYQITNLVNTLKEFDANITKAINWQEILHIFAEGQGIPETSLNEYIVNENITNKNN